MPTKERKNEKPISGSKGRNGEGGEVYRKRRILASYMGKSLNAHVKEKGKEYGIYGISFAVRKRGK